MKMKATAWLVVFILNFVGLNGKGYHPVPTFFNRKYPNGSNVDANRPDFKMEGPFNNNMDLNNMEALLKVWPEEVENAGQLTVLFPIQPKQIKLDITVLIMTTLHMDLIISMSQNLQLGKKDMVIIQSNYTTCDLLVHSDIILVAKLWLPLVTK